MLQVAEPTGVSEQFSQGEEKTYATTPNSCNCNNRFQYATPCKHIVFLRRSLDMELFDKALFSCVYYDSFMLLSETETNEELERQFESFEYFEAEAPKSTSISSATTRYKEIREITDSLAELVAATSASSHVDNKCFLTKLCDIFRAGKTPLFVNDSIDTFEQPSPSPSPSELQAGEQPPSSPSEPQADEQPPSSPSEPQADDQTTPSLPSQESVFSDSLSEGLKPKYACNDRIKSIIRRKEMLDMETVDSFVSLLLENHNFQYQSVLHCQQHLSFQPVDPNKPNFQILLLNSRTHFILSRILSDLTVEIYDSMKTEHLNEETDYYLSHLYPTRKKVLSAPVQQQEGFVDCGLFSLAFLTTFLYDSSPCSKIYNQDLFRKHCLNNLEAKKVSIFPSTCKRGRKRIATYNEIFLNKTHTSVKAISELVFPAGSQPGRHKATKQRRFLPSFSQKK